MQDELKTKKELLAELHELRNRVAELEKDQREPKRPNHAQQDQLHDELGHPLHMDGSLSDAVDNQKLRDDFHRIMLEQRAILDIANVAISLVRDRKQVWINRKAEEMFQYPKEELVGHTTRKLYPSREAYEQLGKDAYPVLAQGLTYETVQELVRRDGSHIWVRYNGRAVDPPDLSVGTLWVLEDITERKLMEQELQRAHDELEQRVAERTETLMRVNEALHSEISGRKRVEEALRQSEERYRLLVDTANEGVWSMDADHRTTYVNRAMAEMLGYAPSEILGKKVEEFFFPEDLAYHEQRMERRHAGEDEVYERRFRRRDGSPLWTLVSAKALKSSEGAFAGSFAMFTDISERKRSEEAVREREARFRALFENAPLPYQSLDEKGFFLDVNRKWLETLGYEKKEVIGRWFGDFLGQGFVEHFDRNFPMFKEACAIDGVEFDMVKKNGGIIQVSFNGRVQLDAQGHFVCTHCIFVDVTERKETERKLRDQERALSYILEDALSGYWDWNIKEGAEYLSPTFKKMFGYDDHELPNLPETWQKLIFPEDLPGVMESFEAHVRTRGKHPYYNEVRYRHKDGSTVWVICAGRVIEWTDDGAPIRMVGCHVDVSERKRVEAAARDAAMRLRESVQAANIGLWDWDLATDRVSYSPEWKSQIGYEEDEIADDFKEWESRVHPDDLAVTLSQVRQALYDPPHRFHSEFRFRHKDGSYRWILAQGSVHPDESGRPFRAMGSHIDITERKKAEDAMRLHSAVMEVVSEGILLVGWEDYLIKWTNHKCERMFGYDPGEMIGMLVDRINAPNDRTPSETRASIVALLVETGEWYAEIQNIKKDGKVFWSLAHVSLFDHPEYGKVMVSALTDITDRKRAEEEKEKLETQLRHAQKMEAVGTLAGGIAHDFNNILAPIIGYTEMVMVDLPPQAAPMRADLEQVLRAAHRARELVKQILAFSRHGQDQKRVPIDVGSIVKEALKLMRASLPTSVEIQQSIQSVTALADPTQIHQVLVNLCTNASHAMEEKGVLGVSLSYVNLTEYDLAGLPAMNLNPGSYVKLSVTDTGHGMDEETMQRIYDPYFTTKEVGKGTGLGLAVVHGIVQRHEGAVSVISEIGKGTRFDVYLPRVEPGSSFDAAKEARDLSKGMERILIVDDEQMVADLGSRMLTQLGYEVTRETNPVSALETFRRDPDAFDLIITDYTMPHITGTELAGEILKIRPDMPIILCTGYSEKGTEASAGELGIRGYAVKPLDRAQLAQLVRKALDENPRCGDHR